MDEAKTESKIKWYKSWWGIILIILFLWPFFLTYWIWKRKWNIKIRISLIAVFWIFGLIILASSGSKSGQQSLQEGYKAGKEANSSVSTPTSTPIPTPTNKPTPTSLAKKSEQTQSPSPTPRKTDDYLNQLYDKMDKATPDDIIVSVDTDRGFIQATRQDDGGWWVVQIMNWWPEFMANFTVKSITREFIYQVYHSNKNIKQVGITIQSGSKYFRAFVGVNQAKSLKEDDWQYLQPTNFYNWIKDIATSREESDRANATFLEENL